jgi:hypothetical protein
VSEEVAVDPRLADNSFGAKVRLFFKYPLLPTFNVNKVVKNASPRNETSDS